MIWNFITESMDVLLADARGILLAEFILSAVCPVGAISKE
jgi:hypothetical protein